MDCLRSQVEGRAAELVGMQSHNVEGLQVVSYTDGQKFDVHHDIGPIDDACEVRFSVDFSVSFFDLSVIFCDCSVDFVKIVKTPNVKGTQDRSMFCTLIFN